MAEDYNNTTLDNNESKTTPNTPVTNDNSLNIGEVATDPVLARMVEFTKVASEMTMYTRSKEQDVTTESLNRDDALNDSSEDIDSDPETNEPFNPNADVDEDGVFLPQMGDEDELVEFTDEDAIAAVLEIDEDGYSESTGMITLESVKDYDPEKDIEEDQRELDETIDIERYRVSMYSTDSDFTVLVLEFDDEEDPVIGDIMSIFDSFKDRCTDYFAGDREEFPLFMVTLMPTRYLGRSALCFSNPITVFKTLDDDNKATHVQLLFKSENSTVAKYDDVSIEDLRQIRDDIAAKERIKAEYEISDELRESEGEGYQKRPVY